MRPWPGGQRLPGPVDRPAGRELRSGAPLTLRRMKEVFHQAAGDFAALPLPAGGQEAGGPGGELYTKYCALGNWDILPFLEEAGCEWR